MEGAARAERKSRDDGPIRLPVDVRAHAPSAVVPPHEDMVRHAAEDPHRYHSNAQQSGPQRNGPIGGILFARRQRSVPTFFPVEVAYKPTLDRLLLLDWNEVND